MEDKITIDIEMTTANKGSHQAGFPDVSVVNSLVILPFLKAKCITEKNIFISIKDVPIYRKETKKMMMRRTLWQQCVIVVKPTVPSNQTW